MAYKRISPMPVTEGGTGNKTLTIHGVLVGESTSAINALTAGTTGQVLIGSTSADPAFGSLGVNSGLTANGVVIANNNSAFTATAAGTTGQVLTGVTSGAPTFQSPAASSITITGDSGGGLTGNSFTFTGASTGLTFAGSGSTETLGGTLVVSNGGTGAGTFTSHGVLLGNTTSAITATAAGTTGQVLTGVTGSAPTFQSPAASSITITGDSGGGLTGNSFTFTGGTTGLTFSGATATETLGGTLAIAHGGTNATSFSTSTGLVSYNGTSLISSTTAKIDSSNRTTNTSQPAFLVKNTSNRTNVTGDGTSYTVVFDTTVFDQNSNFSATTTFTAPVTGRYMLGWIIEYSNVAVSHTIEASYLITTSASYQFTDSNPGTCRDANGNYQVKGSVLAPMTAGDTATVQANVYNSTKTVSINGEVGPPLTFFYGYLVC